MVTLQIDSFRDVPTDIISSDYIRQFEGATSNSDPKT
ncbi:hypothetical protein L917_05786 [Phytophthora nicotianae]|uniref:Uncharacterized protein n=1 Tax=Phytophthora nicotianae TaxID=4792 RepID=W2LJJ6_PHYNI|nr:hypothetical protein L915_05961 [Phytophthora nicotianae]ETL43648.1 hypothetical protein L916_05896 [Phytophthora nicotianae]ETL96815.1 hypothetical protein L917_05786 [Phytophthora nicotianae]